MTDAHPPLPVHASQVFSASEITVVAGVNQGDAIGAAEEVCAGDIYQLRPGAAALRLVMAPGDAPGAQAVAAGSAVGRPGEPVRLLAGHTLIAASGERVELLLLEPASGGRLALPLSPMAPKADYTLIRSEEAPQAVRLYDLVCVSFARGTLITLPSGAQKPIEALAPGDRVLTRDHGAQPVRWVGRATLRAVGAFAPVVIGAGALGNAGDLIVSQHHRMFLYQRERRGGLPTAEVLVQAKHLVDGDRIVLREGGFVDYLSLVFDRHEIIYAEGIPAESLLVNEATLARLPEPLAAEVRARFPGLRHDPHFGTEAGRQDLEHLDRPGGRG